MIYLQKTKDETFDALKAYVAQAEVVTGEQVNFLRTDGGGEYNSTELNAYLVERGIHHEKTNADTPPENGVAEQINRTIEEMACCLLHNAGLPDSFWGYAVLHCGHILNLLPSRRIHEKTTPHELFTGKKPSLAHL
jgi:hypothetical protein